MHVLLLDKETTGLEEGDGHVPIEVAARLIEPGSLKEKGRFHALIKPALGAMSHASTFAVDMHKSSGLLERAVNDGRHLEDVDRELLTFIDDHCLKGDAVHLMGNSVHFDARFIKRWMPLVHKRLHYRIIDVTSVCLFQELFTGKSPMDWEKKKAHTAEADLDETWHEAETYAARLGLTK